MYPEPLKASVHAGFRRKGGQPVRLTLAPGKTTRGPPADEPGKLTLQTETPPEDSTAKVAYSAACTPAKPRAYRPVKRQLKTDLRADPAYQHALHQHQRRELRLDLGRLNDLGSTVRHYEKQHVMKIVPHEMGIFCTYA